MSDYALILHPLDPLVSVNINELDTTLRTLGIIGNSIAIANWYAVGPNFLDQVTFLGCSPVIRLAAAYNGDTGFCRLHLPPPLLSPIWRAPSNAADPRCPRCRVADSTWRTALPAWKADPQASRHICPSCGYVAPLHQWRLREAAGFGCSFVECWGIHPGEAVPGEELLSALTKLSDGPWSWFYTHHSL